MNKLTQTYLVGSIYLPYSVLAGTLNGRTGRQIQTGHTGGRAGGRTHRQTDSQTSRQTDVRIRTDRIEIEQEVGQVDRQRWTDKTDIRRTALRDK